jgi:hypothetical protein
MLDPRPERRPSAAAILGGLDGTTAIPVPDGRGAPVGGVTGRARRALARLGAAVLGDPADRPDGRPGRRRRLVAAAALGVAAAAVATVALFALSTGPSPAVHRPHMTGTTCALGWYNLDGIVANGCESHSDYVAGTALNQGVAVHANLVPVSAGDTFTTHVRGSVLDLCWGSLHVTLTAPARTAEEVTVWHGTTKVGDAVSTNGTPATATVDKPSCFGADSEDLQVTVTAVAATGSASATDFTLTRDGGW